MKLILTLLFVGTVFANLADRARVGVDLDLTAPTGFPTIDGIGNNPFRPNNGAAGQPNRRFGRDPIFPVLEDAPNPRTVSNLVHRQSTFGIFEKREIDRETAQGFEKTLGRVAARKSFDARNARLGKRQVESDFFEPSFNPDIGLSDLFWLFGQFLDHDLSLNFESEEEESTVDIPIPQDGIEEDCLLPTCHIPFHLSTRVGDDINVLNQLTSFLDGSNVYGHTVDKVAFITDALSGKFFVEEVEFSDGHVEEYLPSVAAVSDARQARDGPQVGDVPAAMGSAANRDILRAAGDVRANENAFLASMHTVWVREHNRLVDQYRLHDPTLTSEELYQSARRMVIAQMQHITFNEWLPRLLGPFAPDGRYPGYNPNINADVFDVFATAAFRMGHTMVSGDLFAGVGETEVGASLVTLFFNPAPLFTLEFSVDRVLQGAHEHTQEPFDNVVTPALQSMLFGEIFTDADVLLDLTALNIQRGRDHNMPRYSFMRDFFGLDVYTDFAQMTSNVQLQDNLRFIYQTPDRMDLFPAGLSEDHIPGAICGEMLATIIAAQFENIRAGDRFWYERWLSPSELDTVYRTRFSDILNRNTGPTIHFREDAFSVDPSVAADFGRGPFDP